MFCEEYIISLKSRVISTAINSINSNRTLCEPSRRKLIIHTRQPVELCARVMWPSNDATFGFLLGSNMTVGRRITLCSTRWNWLNFQLLLRHPWRPQQNVFVYIFTVAYGITVQHTQSGGYFIIRVAKSWEHSSGGFEKIHLWPNKPVYKLGYSLL